MMSKMSWAVLAAFTSLSASAAAPVYKIELIPRASGIVPMCGVSINGKGEVTGGALREADQVRMVFRYANGVVTFMPDGQGFSSSAINAAGDVLAVDPVGSWVWRAGGSVEQVSEVSLLAMNDKGMFVGTDYYHGMPWQHGLAVKNGTLMDLGTLGGDRSSAGSVNNLGQVAGDSELPGNAVTHAFIWKSGVMQDIGALYTDSWAQAINGKGHVVGWSNGPGKYDAFLFDGTTMKALPRLQGEVTTPRSLNDKDEIVGSTSTDATLTRQGKTYKLRSLLDASGTGWKRLDDAQDINEQSQIAGCGTYKGQSRAFVATPVTR